jgi:pectate lyase
MSIYHCENVTVQWCLVAESLASGSHGFGGIWGANHSTYHHNLLAHHSSRNPRFASGCGNTDYRNNVLYNWGYNSCYGGEKQQVGNDKFNFTNINMVANYYKPGPATKSGEVSHRIANPSSRKGDADYGKWYISDNFMEGNASVTANNWNGGVQPSKSVFRLDEPWPAMPIKQQTAEEAYKSVLKNAGATLPKRDALDARIIKETRNGTATYGEGGIIDSQKDVGGWPELKSTTAPTDTDHDGMPDEWEKEHGLNAASAEDGSQDTDKDGYTNVEEYLNGTNPSEKLDYTNFGNNVGTISQRLSSEAG